MKPDDKAANDQVEQALDVLLIAIRSRCTPVSDAQVELVEALVRSLIK